MASSEPATGKPAGNGFMAGDGADPMAVACHGADGGPKRPADEENPTSATIGSDEIRDRIETMEAEKLKPSIEVLVKMAERLHPPQRGPKRSGTLNKGS